MGLPPLSGGEAGNPLTRARVPGPRRPQGSQQVLEEASKNLEAVEKVAGTVASRVEQVTQNFNADAADGWDEGWSDEETPPRSPANGTGPSGSPGPSAPPAERPGPGRPPALATGGGLPDIPVDAPDRPQRPKPPPEARAAGKLEAEVKRLKLRLKKEHEAKKAAVQERAALESKTHALASTLDGKLGELTAEIREQEGEVNACSRRRPPWSRPSRT